MSTTATSTAPSPQAVSAWKKKAEKVVTKREELAAAERELAERLEPIRQEYEPDIERLRKEVRDLEGEVATFGTEHRDELFEDGSEIRTKVAVIQGRETPGKVTAAEGYDEQVVTEGLYADRSTRKFVQVKKSLDRSAIKRALLNGSEPIREAIEGHGVTLEPGFSVNVRPKES